MLNYRYAAIEEVPEKFRELFAENDAGEAILTGVAGIKTQQDVDRVLEAKNYEKEKRRQAEAALDQYKKLGDVEELHATLDKIGELEALSKGQDAGQVDALVEARLKSKISPLERQLSQLKEEREDMSGKLIAYQEEAKRRTIHDHIRAAAQSARLRDTAMDDALIIGENIFTIDESGRVITKDNVGVTPGVDPQVWFTEIKNTRPHWWPESQGTGARGGNGQNYGVNPFSSESWNMTEQGKLIREDRSRAEQMAKAAGTTIGGKKPE